MLRNLICSKWVYYLYKDKVLDLDFPISSSDNIKWENHYITDKIKRKCYSFFLSIFIIILTTIILYLLDTIEYEKLIINILIVLTTTIVNLLSTKLLEKMANYEKNDNLTRKISSYVKKVLILKFIISGISINFSLFTYKDFKQYSEVITCILMSMMISIVTENISPLFSFVWTNILRCLDSGLQNGKTTKKGTISEYNELYVGPEFPIGERYCSILVNFTICLLYGTYAPIIYLFFLAFLISTFITDKFLLLNYYKKPLNYDEYLSKFTKKYFFLAILIYFYGIIFHLSNPYLFNYYQNTSTYIRVSDIKFYNVINPFSYIYKLVGNSKKYISIKIFNYSNLGLPYICLFTILFLVPHIYFVCFLYLKIHFQIKTTHGHYFDNSKFEISNLYSIEQLKKYYELKKIQLFKLLYEIRKNDENIIHYIYLIENYKIVIDYLRHKIKNMSVKKDNLKRKEEINKDTFNEEQNKNDKAEILDLESEEKESLKDGTEIKVGSEIKKVENSIKPEITSYNFAFNPDYEIYLYSELLYN